MTASNDVASASTCDRPRTSASAGTNTMPPPTPSIPPIIPPPKPSAAAPMTSCAVTSDPQQAGADDEQDREREGDRALGDALLHCRAGDHAGNRGRADDQRVPRMHVPVEGLDRGAGGGDQDDRH